MSGSVHKTQSNTSSPRTSDYSRLCILSPALYSTSPAIRRSSLLVTLSFAVLSSHSFHFIPLYVVYSSTIRLSSLRCTSRFVQLRPSSADPLFDLAGDPAILPSYQSILRRVFHPSVPFHPLYSLYTIIPFRLSSLCYSSGLVWPPLRSGDPASLFSSPLPSLHHYITSLTVPGTYQAVGG